MLRDALGLIETRSLTVAMDALHAASHAAPVTVSVELIDAAFVVIKIEGDMGAVQAAVDAGAHAAQTAGKLIAARIIPRSETAPSQPAARKRTVPKLKTAKAAQSPATSKAAPAASVPSPPMFDAPRAAAATTAVPFAELEAMSVVKLRQYARTVTNLPIQGRQISMANKQQLLEAIRAGRG